MKKKITAKGTFAPEFDAKVFGPQLKGFKSELVQGLKSHPRGLTSEQVADYMYEKTGARINVITISQVMQMLAQMEKAVYINYAKKTGLDENIYQTTANNKKFPLNRTRSDEDGDF